MKAGFQKTEIAKIIGIHKSTISKELKYNRGSMKRTKTQMDVRQYLLKKRCLDNVMDDKLAFIMHRLNHRPRKRLDWKTPHEIFFDEVVAFQD